MHTVLENDTIYEPHFVKLSVKQVLGWCAGVIFLFCGLSFTVGKYASDFEGLKKDVAILTVASEKQSASLQEMSRQLTQLSEEIKNVNKR